MIIQSNSWRCTDTPTIPQCPQPLLTCLPLQTLHHLRSPKKPFPNPCWIFNAFNLFLSTCSCLSLPLNGSVAAGFHCMKQSFSQQCLASACAWMEVLGRADRQSAGAGFSMPGALGTPARMNSAPVVIPWFCKFCIWLLSVIWDQPLSKPSTPPHFCRSWDLALEMIN